MKIERGFDQITHDPTSVLTVGTFDGVHRGHQAILKYVVERAQAQSGHSAVLTFDPHPRTFLTGHPIPLLSTIEERANFLENLGIDRLIVLPFTAQLANMPAEDYVRDLLVGRIGLQEIVIGHDHHFGYMRTGNRQVLEAMGPALNFTVDVISAQWVKEVVVSSTKIRALLQNRGDMRAVRLLLGRFYTFGGTVVHGASRGNRIGFPTLNIAVNHPDKILPREGVYAVHVTLPNQAQPLQGMMNIGRRPTFEEKGALSIEVHVFDFADQIYDQAVTVACIQRVRGEQKFNSVEELVEQLHADKSRCLTILKALS